VTVYLFRAVPHIPLTLTSTIHPPFHPPIHHFGLSALTLEATCLASLVLDLLIPFPFSPVLDLLNNSYLPCLLRLTVHISSDSPHYHLRGEDTLLVGPNDSDANAPTEDLDQRLILNSKMAGQLKTVLIDVTRCKRVYQLRRAKRLLRDAARDGVLQVVAHTMQVVD
jgi:hypothetical protein